MAARAAPAIFVVLWSTGFIATKYGLNNAGPLTFLAIRMAVVVAMMAVIVAVARPQWPDRLGIAHSVVAGILVHGFYLGGTAVAIAHSIPAGLSALIPGLQPILTSTLANRWLGERVTPLQWAGTIAGPRRCGADPARSSDERRGGMGLAGLGRVAGQHHLGHALPAALLQQDRLARRKPRPIRRGDDFFRCRGRHIREHEVHWTREFVLSVAWLAVMLSIGSIGLLYWLIRRSAATSVASLFYLVPAVTALMAYVLFGERLDPVAITGMIACAAAVFLVNRRVGRDG